tara:strand:- start:112 stop:801 length:690 start_codon:yes stop_codon:yes gene_type:complete
MAEEVFRTIEGFEDYSVSNLGNVLSRKNKDIKLLKPGHDAMGYLHVRLYPREPIYGFYKNGFMKPKLEKIHRLVSDAFLSEPNKDIYQEVNHKDGDKKNNDVTNLEWVTRKQNILHAWETGLNNNGAEKGALKRMKPVMLKYVDGSIRYYQSRVHAAVDNNTSPVGLINKIKNNRGYGRTGFKAFDIEELPKGEVFTASDEITQKVVDYRNRYRGYLKEYNRKKFAERK